MTTNGPVYVLDSFALLAFFRAEPGGRRVRELLAQASQGEVQLVMSVINLGEVFYRTFREHGSDRADEVLGIVNGYAIEMIEVDTDLALAAAQFKGRHRMSYADCIAAALTDRLGIILVTGDPEFRLVEGIVSVEWLPQ